MKKLILGFILGNMLVLWVAKKFFWFSAKIAHRVYTEDPEPFNVLWNDYLVPVFKNAVVNTVEHGVKRTVYGPEPHTHTTEAEHRNYTHQDIPRRPMPTGPEGAYL